MSEEHSADARLSEPSDGAEAREQARRAVQLVLEGRGDEARRVLRHALDAAGPATADVRLLFFAFQVHFKLGEFDEAERFVRRRLAVLEGAPASDEPSVRAAEIARAHTNLGLIFFFRKELPSAEREMLRALEMDEAIGNELGVARDLGNLSLVYESRGEYERARGLLLRSLAIAERIGADDIAAGKLANLGDIAAACSQVEEARGLWERARVLYERVGDIKHATELALKLAHDHPLS